PAPAEPRPTRPRVRRARARERATGAGAQAPARAARRALACPETAERDRPDAVAQREGLLARVEDDSAAELARTGVAKLGDRAPVLGRDGRSRLDLNGGKGTGVRLKN